jgi:hypothetical protein
MKPALEDAMNNTQAKLLSGIISQATAGKRAHSVVEGAIFISAKTFQNVFGLDYKKHCEEYFEVVSESYQHGGGVGSKNYTMAYKPKPAIYKALADHVWKASQKPKSGVEGIDWYKETGNIQAFVDLIAAVESGKASYEKMEDEYSIKAYVGCWNFEDNCQYVTYEKNGPKMSDGSLSGRKYAMGPSMQGMSKRLRAIFDTADHHEIDEVNSHVSFLAAYGKTTSLSTKHIDNYCHNRECFRKQMAEHYGFSQEVAKTLIIAVQYSAALHYTFDYQNTYTDIINENLDRTAPCWSSGEMAPEDFKPLALMRAEMKAIGKEMLKEDFAAYLGCVKSKPRALALLQQQMESERQDWYLEVFRGHGVVVETLQHDGVRVLGTVSQEILEKAETYVKNQLWDKYGIDFREYKLAIKK